MGVINCINITTTIKSSNQFIIFVQLLLVLLLHFEDSLAAIHHGHRYHHHHHHGPHHHKCPHSWHTLSTPTHLQLATTSFWPQDISDSTGFNPDHHEHTPMKLEYTLPPIYDRREIVINEENIFEPESLYHQHQQDKNVVMIPYHSWDDNKHSNVFRIKKIRTNSKKKKKKNHNRSSFKDIYYPEIFDNTTPSNYPTVNKIIVIEEPETNLQVKSNGDIIDSNAVKKQIVKSIIDSKSLLIDKNFPNHPEIQEFNQQDFQPVTPSILTQYQQPQLTSVVLTTPTILTIKDLHDRLNQTLLNRVSNGNGSQIMRSNNVSNITLMIPSNSYNTTFQTSNEGSPTSTKYGSQDFFIKSNFASQNDWNFITSTTESSQQIPMNKLITKTNDNKTNEQLVSSGSTNRQWLSSTTPPVFYFTSQRSILPLSSINPVATIRPSTSTTVRKLNKLHEQAFGEKILGFSAAKRGSHQVIDNNKDKINEAALDIGKLGSIIFAFCISMMLLTAVIVMILHKDIVTEQFRNLTGHIDPRNIPSSASHSNGDNEDNRNRSGSSSGGDESNSCRRSPQDPSMELLSSSNLSTTSSSSIPPPPPPPPPSKSTQHLIEQIIGKQDNNFSGKKCRHYFSRVHRWVPKRPPLPSDLVEKDQQ